ncbi:hypothetical protein JTB14_032673 [Gonioctena quinquepunctata]|nr:hypothetical protein JTB14_032673 [Gonioctena quinquepunctata]
MENLVQTRTRVYISSTMDFKSRVKNWWKKLRLKSALQHVGLLLALMCYTLVGGLIFRRLEYPAELSRIKHFNTSMLYKRQYLIDFIINNTHTSNMDYLISKELLEYEKLLQDSFVAGIPRFPEDDLEKWTTLKAVFFSSTVLTTIGYGHIVPMTTEGRAFCMVFALVGIPLTLTVIADWGRLFAGTVSAVFRQFHPCLPNSRIQWWPEELPPTPSQLCASFSYT